MRKQERLGEDEVAHCICRKRNLTMSRSTCRTYTYFCSTRTVNNSNIFLLPEARIAQVAINILSTTSKTVTSKCWHTITIKSSIQTAWRLKLNVKWRCDGNKPDNLSLDFTPPPSRIIHPWTLLLPPSPLYLI